MKPKERVCTAFAHREPDRVPVDYHANVEIDGLLKQYFGLAADDDELLRQKLDVDFRPGVAPYAGPQLHVAGPGIRCNIWGAHTTWIDHGNGGYWDFCDWPLRDADIDEVEAWPMPDPDDFDYDAAIRQCREYADYFVMGGGVGTGDTINQSGFLRHMEQVMIDLVTDDPAGLRLIDRRQDIEIEVLKRTLEACNGGIDMVAIGEDLGSQRGPLLSLDLFRRHLRPRLQRYIDVAASFDLPVMMHSDGSVDWVYDDLIAMGVNVVDAVQIECANMDPASLKRRFGDRLSFHGVWPTTGALERGTVDEAVAEARDVLSIMMPGGGFAMSPAHLIQSTSPVENVVAVYEMIREHGKY
ncbi:MAG: uroporphyrinogen decarboxylase family protein [Lentisphaeria bacterium]|jgi:uroporphyrinogen decarboxylase|nr:uroporphyrinogen decarboxylase family protein [Lentisphaeria bacterium]